TALGAIARAVVGPGHPHDPRCILIADIIVQKQFQRFFLPAAEALPLLIQSLQVVEVKLDSPRPDDLVGSVVLVGRPECPEVAEDLAKQKYEIVFCHKKDLPYSTVIIIP